MVERNGEDENDLYDGEFCNRFAGSDGTLFAAFQSKKNPLEVFFSQLCRIVYFEYQKSVWHGVIPTGRYKRRIFNEQLPENNCFCVGDVDTCPVVGVAEDSICLQIPMILSEAHLLHADPVVFEKVEGMKPDEEKHSSFIDVHLVSST